MTNACSTLYHTSGFQISSSLTLWDVEAIRQQAKQPTHLRTFKPFKTLKCQSAISCAVFNGIGEMLASSSFDNVVRIATVVGRAGQGQARALTLGGGPWKKGFVGPDWPDLIRPHSAPAVQRCAVRPFTT